MLGLTLNTDILVTASLPSGREPSVEALKAHCIAILNWMQEKEGAKLVYNKFINQEYSDKLGSSGKAGQTFIAAMVTKGRLEIVQKPSSKEQHSVWKKARQEVRPHRGDEHFLLAAMVSSDKILVAEESHFLDKADKIKRHMNVAVRSALEQATFVRTNPA